jgi:hypothetical protein
MAFKGYDLIGTPAVEKQVLLLEIEMLLPVSDTLNQRSDRTRETAQNAMQPVRSCCMSGPR